MTAAPNRYGFQKYKGDHQFLPKLCTNVLMSKIFKNRKESNN